MKPQTTVQWFCLRTKPKREHIAAAILAGRFAIEVFSPRISFVRKTRLGYSKTFTEALFPGYCFARFDLFSEQHKVAGSQHIQGLVRFGNHIPPICPAIISHLRQQFAQNQQLKLHSPQLCQGDLVEIISGSLYGQKGIIRNFDPDSDRASLLIEFLGRQVSIHAPRQHLLKQNTHHETYPKALLVGHTP